MEKDADAYRTISEVSEALDIPAHVLRFWETKFTQIKPLKRGGGRRYYRRADIELLRAIRRLLYEDAYTIRGVQRLLKQQGAVAVATLPPEAVPPLQPEDLGPVDAPGLENLADRSASALVTALASEIAACRDLVAASFGARPEAAPRSLNLIRPRPAAAEPGAPASAIRPP